MSDHNWFVPATGVLAIACLIMGIELVDMSSTVKRLRSEICHLNGGVAVVPYDQSAGNLVCVIAPK